MTEAKEREEREPIEESVDEQAIDLTEETQADNPADEEADEDDNRDPITVAKENLYDQLPFTYKQVDIFCKLAIFAILLIFAYYALKGA